MYINEIKAKASKSASMRMVQRRQKVLPWGCCKGVKRRFHGYGVKASKGAYMGQRVKAYRK